MRIVTSGYKYLDIDAYAGIVAHTELLNMQGVDSMAVSTATFNDSITNTIKEWGIDIKRNFTPSVSDKFVLVDISDYKYFEKFIDIEKVEEIIDHHVGFEDFWYKKIGPNSNIEFIGAASTLVFEKWESSGLLSKMSQLSARLLMCGILDNTLNFGATITNPRDKKAYYELVDIAKLSTNWPETYFKECQNKISSNIVDAIKNDTKTLKLSSYNSDITVGQVAVWEANSIIEIYKKTIQNVLGADSDIWFMNILSVSDKNSYFIAENDGIKQLLVKLLGATFNGDIGVTDRLWLRKEIIKQDKTYN